MADAKITYKSGVIAEINGGQTATLKCKGMKMDDDVTVESIGGGGGDFPADKYFEGGYDEVNLPNATKIKKYAFYCDYTLVNISMPKVTAIEEDAFVNCNKLALTELPSGLTSVGNRCFSGCSKLALTELPSVLTSLGANAFNACGKLALTGLPSGLTSISGSAFYNCFELAITELPSGLTSIGNSAFYSCRKLAITELPSGLTSIDYYAFYGCSGLTSVTFKGTPSTIRTNAFNNCANLTTINVPWAEGEVANAPWGATNATINYNYTGG